MNTTRLGMVLVLSFGVAGCTSVNTRTLGTVCEARLSRLDSVNELQIAVTYELWIPDGVKTLRGVIVHQHGAGTTASIRRFDGGARLALAGAREEMGLRAVGFELSCAE